MVDNDVSFRQCAITEFLVKEEDPTANIHHRIQRVYGDVCMVLVVLDVGKAF